MVDNFYFLESSFQGKNRPFENCRCAGQPSRSLEFSFVTFLFFKKKKSKLSVNHHVITM